LRVGKIGSIGGGCDSGCAVGQTPNVPMWAGIKLFLKMCGGKIFKNLLVRLRVSAKSGRLVSSYSEIVCRVLVVFWWSCRFSTLAGNTILLSCNRVGYSSRL